MDESTLIVFGGGQNAQLVDYDDDDDESTLRGMPHSKSHGHFSIARNYQESDINQLSGDEQPQTENQQGSGKKRKLSRFSKLKRSKTISALKFFNFGHHHHHSNQQNGHESSAHSSLFFRS